MALRKIDPLYLLGVAEDRDGVAQARSRFGCSKQTVYRWLDRLVVGGLLTAETVGGHGNRTMWTLTDEGRKVLQLPAMKALARAQNACRPRRGPTDPWTARELDRDPAAAEPEAEPDETALERQKRLFAETPRSQWNALRRRLKEEGTLVPWQEYHRSP